MFENLIIRKTNSLEHCTLEKENKNGTKQRSGGIKIKKERDPDFKK